MEGQGEAVAVKKASAKKCSYWDFAMIALVALGLLTAVIFTATLFVGRAEELQWKRADACYVEQVEILPRNDNTRRVLDRLRPRQHHMDSREHSMEERSSHEERRDRHRKWGKHFESDSNESRETELHEGKDRLTEDIREILQSSARYLNGLSMINKLTRSSEEDGSNSSEEEIEEESVCEIMPCAKVWVTYTNKRNTAKGLLHPDVFELRDNPECSISPCSDNLNDIPEETMNFLSPYLTAMKSGEEVECYFNKDKEPKSLWQEFTCGTMDLWDEMTDWGEDERDDEDEHSSMDKRSIDEDVAHLVAHKSLKASAVLAIILPVLCAFICLFVLAVRAVLRLVKSTKVTEREEPYAVSRGPSFIGKKMRSPSVWSLSLSSAKANEAWCDNKGTGLPQYDEKMDAVPDYEEVMKNAPPAYCSLGEEEEKKGDEKV
ncbi:hypothetical protein CAPTEDRAFT_226447 [Capitella teleta]|uniref:Uncharacterized protein n=1 Tax=Capitella teleta TaxID=283909 RepID=R7TB96_CAPTE|nr:hypothetical protein CAPTEDRAFT_226447 [Capitella teleta]|eukprot:ELT88737.1 hypothetical protein CAPTEDRAFT_226447 [Capitella teleta]